jgi:hypothetical protein
MRSSIFLSLFLPTSLSLNPLYPPNSLTNRGSIYEFGGILPTPRVRHTVDFLEPYVIVYGGVSPNETLLNDIHLFDVRFQAWSGPISRLECCNEAEQTVERLGSLNNDLVSSYRIGYHGGVPAARADHGAASFGTLFYIFGGESEYGLMNDFFQFDPIQLQWKAITGFRYSWPQRRAGHTMNAEDGKIVVFGGRSLIADNTIVSMNDAWIFVIDTLSWQYVRPIGETPCGRQYAASTIFSGHLWIFGGSDFVSSLFFNDMWSLDLSLHTWTRHSPNKGFLHGFLPPPLHHASLIPTYRTPGILVYGGIGSGGGCGGQGCGADTTALGQIYRFDITLNTWDTERVDYSQFIAPEDATFSSVGVMKTEWQFAKISSDKSWDTGGSGKMTKRGALERIAVSKDRYLVFEFGGVEYIPADSEELTPVSSSSLWHSNNPPDRLPPRSGQGSDLYDSGGNLVTDLWNTYTGEYLAQSVQIPVNHHWWYSNLLSAVNSSAVVFRRVFREYTVDTSEIVLLLTDDFDFS